MIAGIFLWIVSITLVTGMFIRTKPEKIRNDSPINLFKLYNKYEKGYSREKNLNKTSNYLGSCLALTTLSGMLLFIGATEVIIRKSYGGYLPLGFIIFIFVLVIGYYKIVFSITDFISISQIAVKEIHYKIRDGCRRWRWCPFIHTKQNTIYIFDYQILEYLEGNKGKTITEISHKLQTKEKYVQQRFRTLTDKNIVTESNEYFFLTSKGRKLLYGYENIHTTPYNEENG